MTDPQPSAPSLSPLSARTLRFWGAVAPAYGLILALAVITLLPWKSPAFSVGLLAYAALWIAAGVGLWRRAHWGWRLGLAAGFVGLLLMVVVCSGLVASWVYLHAIYGDFGLGASIGALLFASVGLQVLGLVPGLLLRALLRREVRAELGRGRPAVERLPKVALALLLAPLPAGLGVRQATAYDPVAELSAEQRATVLSHLRARLDGTAPVALTHLAGVPVGAGPLYVTLWNEGGRVARVTGEGADLAAAVQAAGDALAAHPKVHGQQKVPGQLKVDRVLATATVPFADSPLLGVPVVALSVNPGLDGLQRVSAQGSAVVLPDDLLKLQAFGHAPLVPGIREMRFGLDGKGVLQRLGMAGARLERLRTEGFVSYRGESLPVVRGNTPPDLQGPEGWYRAAVDGGHFVLRQIQADGRFHYQYLPYEDRHPPTKPEQYSLPRHAGTVYALALLHGLTGDQRFKVGAEKAIAWLDQQIPGTCGDAERACVTRLKGTKADLGSTALTLVGMLEYRRRTADHRYDPTIRRLVAFVLALQKEDGDFFHDFDLRNGQIDRATRSMFYSEEAALALVLAHAALGEPAWLTAAERALDFLTGPKYAGFFLGGFIYGADHWTCIAVDEAFDRLPKPGYLDFCLGYSAFIGRMQYEAQGWDNADFAGHYGFGGFMVPQAPAAAGFTEAVLSTWSLAKKHGRDFETVAAQAGAALDALTRDRIRLDNAWMMPRPYAARGGIRRSLVEQEVRIDFTQHAASALIRGAELGGYDAKKPAG